MSFTQISGFKKPIGILAAIALPAYQNYMQRSANGACLAEARSYMGSAVAQFAIDGTVPAYNASACDKAESKAPTADELKVATDATVFKFVPLVRGAKSEHKQIDCKGAGNCSIGAVIP